MITLGSIKEKLLTAASPSVVIEWQCELCKVRVAEVDFVRAQRGGHGIQAAADALNAARDAFNVRFDHMRMDGFMTMMMAS